MWPVRRASITCAISTCGGRCRTVRPTRPGGRTSCIRRGAALPPSPTDLPRSSGGYDGNDSRRARMKTRALGRGGLVVSAIGLGTGSATTNFGERDDAEQIATMRRALDRGVNFFDTSDAYSKGRHEELIGRAIQGRRHEVILATKFGNLDLPGGKKGYNGRPEYVSQACAASLRRLGVDVIDLYYLHRIDPDVPI